MNEPKNFRAIMLSSTFTDLKRHREQVIKAIREFGYKAEVMEESGARAEVDVIDSSLKMVRDSIAYALIIGRKYGQTPICPERNPAQLSITELEFNEAMRLQRPILLFIMDKTHPIIEDDIELDPDKRKKLDAFRERAKRMRDGEEVHRVYQTFESLEQFSTAAIIAIGKLAQQVERYEREKRPREVPVAAENPQPRRALSNIPINLPRHFIGRDEDLAAIEKALKCNEGRVAITALHGLRGVGKTTLAAAYASRHAAGYRATWWIRAESPSTMRADLFGLGVGLGWVVQNEKEEPALAGVLERLRHEGDGILLIYDNANNSEEIWAYLPPTTGAQIIVTSNAPNWGDVAAPVEIEVWPKEVGGKYLIARTGRGGEHDAALSLSEALGGLPLAHEQAAAYCERIGISLVDYQKRFEAAPAKLLDNTRDAPRGYHDGLTVAKTFALAIDEAAKLHPGAEPLIAYAALLEPEPIPLFLFSDARDIFGEPLASALANDGLDEAVAALRSFALIDCEVIPDERDTLIKTNCIRLHRLVRQIAAVRRRPESNDGASGILLRALSATYPYDVSRRPDTWPRARRLDAHALALVGCFPVPPSGAEQEASLLLNELAAYRLRVLAAYDQARPLFEKALLLDESTLGPNHPGTATSLNNLAELLRAQGDIPEARQYFERAFAINEKALGPDHPQTAMSAANLAGLLIVEKSYAKARSLLERALAIHEKVLGPEHSHTATSAIRLAGLLRDQGALHEAKALVERSLAIYKKEYGVKHPYTATAYYNLGIMLEDDGDLVGARSNYENALAIRESILGPEHPDTHAAADSISQLRKSSTRESWLSRVKKWLLN